MHLTIYKILINRAFLIFFRDKYNNNDNNNNNDSNFY